MIEEIQVADIAKELERQWEAQEADHQIRASLFNLILYSHNPKREAYLKELVQAIIEKFPCRIIFIRKNEDPAQNYMRVNVSNVLTTKGGLTIACDQINIDVTHSQLKRVPYIILPHLIADLPIYLLWGQDPSHEDEILPHLHPLAEKLIFDSECAQDLKRFCRAILKVGNGEVTDVNWVALHGWRRIFADSFDTPEKIKKLRRATLVRIHYQKYEGDIQAQYLKAWLASQLDLDEKVFEMVPHDTLGPISSIEIQTEDETLFSFERKERLPQVVVHISTPQECAMPFTLALPDTKKSSSFLRDLLYRGAGAHFRKVLAKIAET